MEASQINALKNLLSQEELAAMAKGLSIEAGTPTGFFDETLKDASSNDPLSWENADVPRSQPSVSGESDNEYTAAFASSMKKILQNADIDTSTAVVIPGVDTPGHKWTHEPPKFLTTDSRTHNPYLHFELEARHGELAEFGAWFAPIVAVSKFPYKYVETSAMQSIASAFFDGGKFWMREWDL
jgi:hypothetical protein